MPRPRALVVERADRLQGAQDPQLPVVLAAGRDRVGVRAHHDRGPARLARSLAEDVAHLVDGDAQPGLAHPANEQVATALVLVAQRQAGEAATLGGADPPQLLDALLQALAIDPHVASPRGF